MKVVYRLFVVLLAFASSVELDPSFAEEGDPKVPIISMTGQQLHTIGIALQSTGVPPLPNSCASAGSADLSVSNEMLSAFRTRGFTLESLCLGLASWFRFDPETGKPVPFASLPNNKMVPLNLPNCFKRAVPFLDCNWLTEQDWGSKLGDRERADMRKTGQTIDAVARDHIKSKGYTGTFSPYDMVNKPGNIFGDTAIMLQLVMFSKALPLGYGYALQGPEGSDPEEEKVDLRTYSKKSDAVPVWSNFQTK
jgi:hypothetical protein